MTEGEELEQWLAECMQCANALDCGSDLDQCEQLSAKFDEFKQSMRVGAERMAKLEATGLQLIEKASEMHAEQLAEMAGRLRGIWAELEERTHSRERALEVAECMHRLRREAELLDERIREKRQGMPKELGRDAKQAYALMLSHEVFENEVAQLHEQLEVRHNLRTKLDTAFVGIVGTR